MYANGINLRKDECEVLGFGVTVSHSFGVTQHSFGVRSLLLTFVVT